MKKLFTGLILTLVLVYSGVSNAGPIDWCMDLIGYTPTNRYQEAVSTLKEAQAVLAARNEMITTLNDTISYLQGLSTTTVILSVLFGLGLAGLIGHQAGVKEWFKAKASKAIKAVESKPTDSSKEPEKPSEASSGAAKAEPSNEPEKPVKVKSGAVKADDKPNA
jgi:hypothetical protein